MHQFSRISAFADMSAGDMAAIRALAGPPAAYRRGQSIQTQGEAGPRLFMLEDGWVSASLGLSDGGCQLLKIHLPGDIMGSPSLPYTHAVDSLTALTLCRVRPIPLNRIGTLFAEKPRVAAMLFLSAQEERTILMDRLTMVGRLDARRRMIAFLLHLNDRLALAGMGENGSLTLPLSQQQIGDLLGLTPVHVNRTLRGLAEEGVIRRQGRHIELVDLAAMRKLNILPQRHLQFSPDWLPESSNLTDLPH